MSRAWIQTRKSEFRSTLAPNAPPAPFLGPHHIQIVIPGAYPVAGLLCLKLNNQHMRTPAAAHQA
jgi:hypothetical protein